MMEMVSARFGARPQAPGTPARDYFGKRYRLSYGVFRRLPDGFAHELALYAREACGGRVAEAARDLSITPFELRGMTRPRAPYRSPLTTSTHLSRDIDLRQLLGEAYRAAGQLTGLEPAAIAAAPPRGTGKTSQARQACIAALAKATRVTKSAVAASTGLAPAAVYAAVNAHDAMEADDPLAELRAKLTRALSASLETPE